MRTELDQIISDDCVPQTFKAVTSVFLDSEDLTNLEELQDKVRHSQNVLLLLTNGVLLRPWCLIEIVTALRENITIFPVELKKPGASFNYPDKEFYSNLENGDLLDTASIQCLQENGVNLMDVSTCLQRVFKQIALPYSPHRAANIRRIEIDTIVNAMKGSHGPGVQHEKCNAFPR